MHEVLIIGGGPAGLTAGMYCRMRKMSVIVIEAGRVGGQLVSLYGDKPVHDWPGYHHIIAGDLAGHLIEHARALEVEMVGNRKVIALARIESGFEVAARDVVSGAEHKYSAQAVIVAIGGGAFEPRKLKVAGEETLGEEMLTYRMPDRTKVKDRDVVVVGGGDSGLESAQSAHEAGGRVTMVQVLESFTGMESNIDRVKEMKIPARFNTRVKGLEIENGTLRAVMVQTKGESAPVRLPSDLLGREHRRRGEPGRGQAVGDRDRGQSDQGGRPHAHLGRGHLCVR